MRNTTFTNVAVIALALCLITLLSYRLIMEMEKAQALKTSVAQEKQTAAESAIPAPTSAHFTDGDALKGLGGNWTYLSQTEARADEKPYLDGTKSTRESVIKLVSKETQLILAEADITDGKKMQVAIKKFTKTEVAGRQGYVMPAADLAGGTQLLLVGSSTVLMVQDANTAMWPKDLDQEVANYIATVRVP